jgi:hypothetical protein
MSTHRGAGATHPDRCPEGAPSPEGTLPLVRSALPSNALLTAYCDPRQWPLLCARVARQVPEAMYAARM